MRLAYTPSLLGLAMPASGQYFYFQSPGASATSAAAGVGTLRLAAFQVTAPIRLSRLGGEVTSAGDVGSEVRVGVYTSDSDGLPDSLLVDGGVIDGNSAAVQEVTIDLALRPGVYFTAAAVQTVTTTQPTIRSIGGSWLPPIYTSVGTLLPGAAGSVIGYSITGVTGALPSAVTGSLSVAGSCLRMIGKVA